MIELSSVSRSFGSHTAVRGVTTTIRPGEATGLLGPNGAGKTTLLRMITGYLAPTLGSVAVCGHDTLRDADAARLCVGYLPETVPAYPEMSVRGFLFFRARLFGLAWRARRPAVQAAITRCWLDDVADRRIGHLSKGYRQRVGLAAATLHDPRVMVLDEPTSGLDPSQITQMRELVRSLARAGPDGQPRTVLFSSHILPEVEQTCDRVLIMAAGQLRADGTPRELVDSRSADAPLLVTFVPGVSVADARRAVSDALPGWRVDPAPHSPAALIAHPQAGIVGDPAESVARCAAARGLLITELRRERPSLEHVFLSVISEPAPPPPSPAFNVAVAA